MENLNVKELRDTLSATPKNAWEVLSEDDRRDLYAYCDRYLSFISANKTEREAVRSAVAMAQKAGYTEYSFGMPLRRGEKYYFNNRGKSLFLFDMGTDARSYDLRIAAAHVDAPRLDLKQNPLYSDSGLAMLKTHYYGGIKKYQWATVPLALHGTVIRQDGSSADVVLGEDPSEPVFYISDLLPHLGKDQMQKTLADGITAEQLNLICGSRPIEGTDEKEGDTVALRFLSLLHEKYGITERDLLTAELCAVPAGNARFVGLDRSLLSGYGHDDRICAYTALTGLLRTDSSSSPRMVILADKEEIGSVGNTGMRSAVLDDLLTAIASACGVTSAQLRANALCLSADVAAAFDPTFADVYDKRNSAYAGNGLAVCKFTGARGKSGASDASAETAARVRDLFDRNDVVWQMCEMGKVDQGGGGTVAAYLADLNIDVLDVGVALLSMHAPCELASAADLYMAHRGFSAFFAGK